MKKTKKILFVLRLATEVVAFLLVFVGVAALLFGQTAVYAALVSLWPLVLAVFIGYVIFSFGEDYVNDRILKPHF